MSRLTKRCPQCDQRKLARDRSGHEHCTTCGWRDTWSEEVVEPDGLAWMDRVVPGSLYPANPAEREAAIAAVEVTPEFEALLERARELEAQRLGEAA